MPFTTIKYPESHSVTGQPIGVRIQADPAWDTYDSYRVDLVLQKEDTYRSGTFITTNTIPGYPDSNGRISWNLSALINSWPDIDPPDFVSIGNKIQTENVKRYQFVLQEYADGVQVGTGTTSSVLYAVKGSLSGNEYNTLAPWRQGKKFLTDQPRKKYVTDCQPEWLTFILSQSVTTVHIKCHVYYDNGGDAAYDPVISFAADRDDLISVAASYSYLGLGLLGSTVIKWDVWLEDDLGNVLTETMTYILKTRDFNSKYRYYVFANRYGAYDTLRTGGRLKREDVSQIDSFARMVDPVDYPTNPPRGQHRWTEDTTYQQYSGFLRDGEVPYARQIQATADLYRIGNDEPNPLAQGNAQRIQILAGKVNTYEDDALNGWAFSYQKLYENQRA